MEEQKKNPELRFEGFTGDWKEEDLGFLAEFTKGQGYSKNDLRATGSPIILYGRLYTNYQTVIDEVDTFTDEQENSYYSSGGEVIVPASGETQEDIVRASVVTKSNIILGGDLNIVKPNESIDSNFLALTISNGRVYRDLVKKAQGKSVVHIRNGDLKEATIPYPGKIEQQQIGSFFKNIDQLIAQHQKKHHHLVTLKKSMLEKMFPKKGQTVPEIRFKGFEGDWDILELGEVSPIRGGFAFKSSEFREKGVPIVKISNILPSGDVGGEFDFYDIQDQDEQYLLPHKSAVLAMSGATTGKVSILINPSDTKIYQNQRVGYFQNLEKANYDFISTIVRSELFSRKINSVLVAGAQPNVSPKEINSFEFGFPKDPLEQEGIGQYFSSIDSLISSHQKQIQKLKNFKQSLSEKMFA